MNISHTNDLNENQVLLAARMVREYYYPSRDGHSPDWVLIFAIRELLKTRPDASPEEIYDLLIMQSKIKSHGDLARYVASSFVASVASKPTCTDDSTEVSVFTGWQRFSLAKISAMSSFFAYWVPDICEAKLNLLLFYSDFANYFNYGRSISGSRYVRQFHGPVVYQYDRILKALEYTGALRLMKGLRCELGNLVREKPSVDGLSLIELISMQWELSNFGAMTALEIGEYSQNEYAYRFTRLDDFIAYEYARLLRNLPEA